MESQRVTCLTEGYLRGWLKFDYSQKTSHLREAIIIDYIENQRLYGLLQNRLLIETIIRSSIDNKQKGLLDPIYDVSKSLIGLKLPLALAKDTIDKTPTKQVSDDLSNWKEFLEKVNKK